MLLSTIRINYEIETRKSNAANKKATKGQTLKKMTGKLYLVI